MKLADRTQKAHEVLAELIRHVNQGSQTIVASDFNLPQMSESDISHLLRELSSSEVGILRATQDASTFFILDDWLPALKAATPNPELVFLEDYVGKKYHWWLQWLRREEAKPAGIHALSERRRLLSDYELKKLAKGKSSLGNDPGLLAYFARSRSYRNWRSLLRATLATICIVGLMVAYVLVRKDQAQKLERGWGLPDDFAKQSRQISELSVVCMVDDLTLMPPKLTYLEANCRRISSLKGLPPGLRHLGISDTEVSDLANLPNGIEELNISYSKITSIDGIAKYKNLVDLDIRDILVTNVKLLPAKLLRLKLSHSGIDSLEGLPGSLTDLELSGTRVGSLLNVPNSVQRLRIAQNSDLKIDHLPEHLELLETSSLPKEVNLPTPFRTLIFSSPGPLVNEVDFIPEQIKDVEFHNSLFKGDLPAGLDSLKIYDETSSIPLQKIPAGLQTLKIRWGKGVGFSALPPKGLVSLDISESVGLDSLFDVPRVSVLDISHTNINNLNDVPDSVTSLRFNFCKAASLTKFPPNLKELYLGSCTKLDLIDHLPESVTAIDLSGTAISDLPELKGNVIFLDISGTNIRGRLPKLPETLQTLVLNAGQITTLGKLPKSVKKLIFKGSRG
jgi:hypothetical protein